MIQRGHDLNEDMPTVGAADILDNKYQLIHPLDEGGMGSVYAAQNLVLGVPVAIKVIRADAKGPAKAKLAARLLQEAHAAAKVVHPAIVQVMDLGTAPNGDPYLVMELLTGDDLAMVLDEQGEVRPVKAVRTLLPLAHGLAAAHEKKVVHRDLKPENILLAEKEGGGVQPKIIDFGLAKTRIPRRKRLTQIGDAFGTPDYMSPEQMRGEDVTAQADVWAFCVVLYEMLTGQPPFEGQNFRLVMRRILEDDPVPITTLGIGDADLWAVIEKGLAKDTRRRWASMRDLGTALARWLLDQGITEDIAGGSLEALWINPNRRASLADVFGSVPPPPPEVQQPGLTADGAQAPPSYDPLFGPPPSSGHYPGPAPAPDALPSSAGAPIAAAAAPDASLMAYPSAAADDTGKKGRAGAVGLVLLWVVALVGIAGAVTGYLGISLPGIPARAPAGSWWPLPTDAANASDPPEPAPTADP
ncbi:MAG: serine/threonine protein kinase [Deltaproteobacteria bacterium]|jgi:serine/threonine-protein kinase|nr:serine/threonine protein kinase [Deltaproteobacteria bacterium]MBW2533466.1 serine/threonine protein kinase [Deltaproteobacteria bacterium]